MPRGAWRWMICGLLLLASMLNYMDRQVLANTAKGIKAEFGLSNEDYGYLDTPFALSFVFGGILFGCLVDSVRLRWTYAAVVAAWSLAGMSTVFAGSFVGLLICRGCLGLAEGGHWPCAIRTTLRILPRRDRPLGNGLLQSGAALGAALTPFVIYLLISTDQSRWRIPFLALGSLGLVWAVAWLFFFREGAAGAETAPAEPQQGIGIAQEDEADRAQGHTRFRDVLLDRRLWILALLSGLFNAPWQFLRHWFPTYLGEAHSYSFESVAWLTFFYYLAADAGSIACGWYTRRLAKQGLPIAAARWRVMLGCALLAALLGLGGVLPRGPLLEALFLIVGFGLLGMFPNFYSLTQEISARHQGKITATMGVSCWVLVAAFQPLAGRGIDYLGIQLGYGLAFALGGLLPLLGVAVLWLSWPKERPPHRQ